MVQAFYLVDCPAQLYCTWIFKAKRTQQGNLLHFISTKHDMNEEGRSWLLWQLVKARESNLVLTLLSDTSDKKIQERQYKGPDSQSGVREVKKEGGNC